MAVPGVWTVVECPGGGTGLSALGDDGTDWDWDASGEGTGGLSWGGCCGGCISGLLGGSGGWYS